MYTVNDTRFTSRYRGALCSCSVYIRAYTAKWVCNLLSLRVREFQRANRPISILLFFTLAFHTLSYYVYICIVFRINTWHHTAVECIGIIYVMTLACFPGISLLRVFRLYQEHLVAFSSFLSFLSENYTPGNSVGIYLAIRQCGFALNAGRRCNGFRDGCLPHWFKPVFL